MLTFLWDFEEIVSSKRAGIMCACADDLGAALKALKFLKDMQPIF